MADLQKIADALSVRFDKGSRIVFGVYRGYTFAIDDWSMGNRQTCCLTLPVSRDGYAPDANWAKTVAKSDKSIISGSAKGYIISFPIKSGMTKKKLVENCRAALQTVTNACISNGYQPCDETKGQACTPNVCYVGGKIHFMDDVSFGEISYEKRNASMEEKQKNENVLAGCLGALLGSIVGGAVILLVAQLGYVSLVGGVCMGALTMWGYQKLAGKMTVKGIVIGAICIIAITYFAERMDWAITIFREIVKDDDGTLWEAYQMQDLLLEWGFIEKSNYILSFVEVYLFSVIGAVVGVIGFVSKDQAKNTARKLG